MTTIPIPPELSKPPPEQGGGSTAAGDDLKNSENQITMLTTLAVEADSSLVRASAKNKEEGLAAAVTAAAAAAGQSSLLSDISSSSQLSADDQTLVVSLGKTLLLSDTSQIGNNSVYINPAEGTSSGEENATRNPLNLKSNGPPSPHKAPDEQLEKLTDTTTTTNEQSLEATKEKKEEGEGAVSLTNKSPKSHAGEAAPPSLLAPRRSSLESRLSQVIEAKKLRSGSSASAIGIGAGESSIASLEQQQQKPQSQSQPLLQQPQLPQQQTKPISPSRQPQTSPQRLSRTPPSHISSHNHHDSFFDLGEEYINIVGQSESLEMKMSYEEHGHGTSREIPSEVLHLSPSETSSLSSVTPSTTKESLPATSPVDSASSSIPSATSPSSNAPNSASWFSGDKPALDEPQFQIVTPQGNTLDLASVKRNAEFHDLFPDFDTGEKLIDDYTCAWLGDVLLHGRMYVSDRHLCFFTKVIWTYVVVLPLDEIESVDKKVVGGLFDNAMEVRSQSKKYYFTSFLSRNRAYETIQKVMEGYPENVIELKPVASPAIAVPRRTSSTRSSENILNAESSRRSRSMGSMDDGGRPPLSALSIKTLSHNTMGLAEIVSPGSNEELLPALADAITSTPDDQISISTSPSSQYLLPTSSSKKHIIHQKHMVSTPTPEQLASSVPTKISSPNRLPQVSSSSFPSKPFLCDCIADHELQKKCLDTIIENQSVQEVWDLLYSSESVKSKFCHHLWEKLGYTGIKASDWVPASESPNFMPSTEKGVTFEKLQVGWKRKIEYVMPLSNPLGPKSSLCFISETVRSVSPNNFCVESITQNPDVPSGNCFQVKSRFCILFQEEKKTRVLSSCAIDYLKTTWIKMALDVAVPDGVKAYQLKMAEELKLYVQRKPSSKADGSVKPHSGIEGKRDKLEKLKSVTSTTSLVPQQQQSIHQMTFVQFIRTSNVGVGIVIFMIALILINVLGLFFLLFLNAKLNILLARGGTGGGGGGGGSKNSSDEL